MGFFKDLLKRGPDAEAAETPKPAESKEKSAKELGQEDLNIVVENAKILFGSLKNALANLGRRAWKGGMDILATTIGYVEKGGKKAAKIIEDTPGFIKESGEELSELSTQAKDAMIEAGYSAAATTIIIGLETGVTAYNIAQEIKKQGLDWKDKKVKEAVDGVVALQEKGVNIGDVLRIVGVMKMKEASDAATQLKDSGIEIAKSGSAAVINAGIELIAHGINLKEAINEKGRNYWNKTTDIMGKAWDGSKELYLEARGAKNRFFERVGQARKNFNEGASQLWDKFVGTAELKGENAELRAELARVHGSLDYNFKAQVKLEDTTNKILEQQAAQEDINAKQQEELNRVRAELAERSKESEEEKKQKKELLKENSRLSAALRKEQPDEVIDATEGLEEDLMEKGA